MDFKKMVLVMGLIVSGQALAMGALEQANEYFYLGEYRAAIKAYKEVLNQLSDPAERSRVRYNLGVSYERLGEYELALKEYETVRKILPEADLCISRVKGLLPPPGSETGSPVIPGKLKDKASERPHREAGSESEPGQGMDTIQLGKEAEAGSPQAAHETRRAWGFYIAIPVVLITAGFGVRRLWARHRIHRLGKVKRLLSNLTGKEGLIRLLSWLAKGRKTGEITITTANRSGFITVKDGQVINAFATDRSNQHPSNLRGEEAFYQMMGWDGVALDLRSRRCSVNEQNITIATKELLCNAQRNKK